MKLRLSLVLLTLLLAGAATLHGQSLEATLDAMDKAAANFHNAQANFEWDQYTKVVDEHDIQKGTMYFKREGDNVQVATDITSPSKKYVLVQGGRVMLYQPPPLDQVTEYSTGKNKQDVESFMVLGFGGRGHDLAKSYDVKYDGVEQAQGVNADKLELTPKNPRLKSMFPNIVLWIDPARGISVQQKFTDSDGNYRLAKYSDIQINGKIPNDVFKLKTTSHTKVVRPNG